MGTVNFILVRKKSKELPTEMVSVQAIENCGLEGDHYNKPGGSRQITIIQQEHLDEASDELNFTVKPILTRRNIVVQGVSLNSIPNNSYIRIGDAVVQKTGDCPPCETMNKNLGKGGRAALEGKGGITARISKGGTIKIGDLLEILN